MLYAELTTRAITSWLNNLDKSLRQLHFANLRYSQRTYKATPKCRAYSLLLRMTSFKRFLNPESGPNRMETKYCEVSPSAIKSQPTFSQVIIKA